MTDNPWEQPHLKEFLPYLDYLKKESERGRVLISTGFMEEQLRQTLLAFMMVKPQAEELVEGGSAPFATFSSRIAGCYVLGLISEDEHHDLNLIRKIRNDFAHDFRTSFKTPSVVDRCKILRHRAMDYVNPLKGETIRMDANGQFQTAAVGIIMNLVNRPHYVAKQRAAYHEWPR